MHRVNRSQPLGIACLFMSLAILPFSLKAAGINTGLSLSAAAEVFSQLSGVIGTGYDPSAEVLWAVAEPSCDGESVQAQASCSHLRTPEIPDCGEEDSATVSSPSVTREEQVTPLRCRRATRKAKPVRLAAITDAVTEGPGRLKIELPVQPRVITEIMQLKALSLTSVPVEFSRLRPESLACSKARKQRESEREGATVGWQRQMHLWLKLNPPSPAAGRFPMARPSTPKPPNRSA